MVGPVLSSFMASRAFLRIIQGPVGSAKTTGCILDIFPIAYGQAAAPDRMRRTKFAFVRDTYRNLQRTTMISWFKWVPKTKGHWVGGGGGQPATHTLTIPHPSGDGSVCEIVLEFIALDGASIEDVMSGWEGTAVYFDEINLVDEAALDFAIQRVGRYPGGFGERCTWWGVWGSLNAPSTTNWTYRRLIAPIRGGRFNQMIEEKLRFAGMTVADLLGNSHSALAEYFRQPGAFEAGAENLSNLPGGSKRYYAFQMAFMKDHEVERKVHNRFGADRSGKPVYPEWRDTLHVSAAPLEPVPGIPLVLGADAGLTPAIIVAQYMPNGQWRILDEIVLQDSGAKRLGDVLNQTLKGRFPGYAWTGWGDPAADARSDEDETSSWLKVLSGKTGRTWRPAPSNSIETRLECVRSALTRLIDGEPGLLVSPSCETVIEGFNSGYRYRKLNLIDSLGEDRFDPKPEKNKFSHIHDALQYTLLGGGEYHEVLGRKQSRAGGQVYQAATGFDVWGR